MSLGRANAQELLVQGIAAAQSGRPKDREEAEFYLEWVLRTDADMDQQLDAWYWLSRITDDPVRKRECLENVLAARPTHPEARRDLAILEGRLKPDNMRANPLAQGAAVEVGGQIEPGQVRRFPCPKCGATVSYDPLAGVVRCQFCGTAVDAEGRTDESASSPGIDDGAVNEQDWVAAIYTEQGHRWALPEESVLKCEHCGAAVTLGPAVVSGRCAYCGSPQLVRVEAAGMGELREPDGVLPFALDRAGAARAVRRWLDEQGRRLGIPDDLGTLAALQSGTPVYLPFWSFDIAGSIEWSGYIRPDADLGGVGLNEIDNMLHVGGVAVGLFTGNMDLAARSAADMAAKKYDRGNLAYSSGTASVLMNDTLVPGSRSLPADLLAKLDFDTQKAVGYREELLAVWPAEVYSVPLGDASLDARERAMKQADREIEMQSGGTPAANLRIDRRGLGVLSYKLLLMPLWVVMYTYKDRLFRAVVNGQSGQVEGDVPRTGNPVGRLLARQ